MQKADLCLHYDVNRAELVLVTMLATVIVVGTRLTAVHVTVKYL